MHVPTLNILSDKEIQDLFNQGSENRTNISKKSVCIGYSCYELHVAFNVYIIHVYIDINNKILKI